MEAAPLLGEKTVSGLVVTDARALPPAAIRRRALIVGGLVTALLSAVVIVIALSANSTPVATIRGAVKNHMSKGNSKTMELKTKFSTAIFNDMFKDSSRTWDDYIPEDDDDGASDDEEALKAAKSKVDKSQYKDMGDDDGDDDDDDDDDDAEDSSSSKKPEARVCDWCTTDADRRLWAQQQSRGKK